MTPWNYSDYKKSIERNVSQGMTQLGFNLDQSIGYAHNELSFRLEEFPGENVLALTALAISAHQGVTLSDYKSGDELYDELKEAYAQGQHEAIATGMEPPQAQEFLRDVEAVAKTLGIG